MSAENGQSSPAVARMRTRLNATHGGTPQSHLTPQSGINRTPQLSSTMTHTTTPLTTTGAMAYSTPAGSGSARRRRRATKSSRGSRRQSFGKARTRHSGQFNVLGEYDIAIVIKNYDKVGNGDSNRYREDCDVIMDKLRDRGMETSSIHSFDRSKNIILVKAHEWKLKRHAEMVKMRKEYRCDDVTDWRAFTARSEENFRLCSNESLFRSSERQFIIDDIIQRMLAEAAGDDGKHSIHRIWQKRVEQCMPLHRKERQDVLHTAVVTFWRRNELVKDDAADSGACDRPRRFLSRAYRLEDEVLDELRKYYGETIAFYFAWLSFYAQWLVLPSVAGSALFALQVAEQSLDNPFAGPYAVLVAIWSTSFIVCWRRRSAVLAHRWGVLRYEEEEVRRPQFDGDEVPDPTEEGETTLHFPSWKRWRIYAFSYSICCTCICVVLYIMMKVLIVRDLVRNELAHAEGITQEEWNAFPTQARLGNTRFWSYMLITPCLYGLLVPMLNAGFSKLARCLNDLENHRTESRYRHHLIVKTFSFRFINTFSPLYYYAFMHSMLDLAFQLAAFMTLGQFGNNILWQTVWPRLQVKHTETKMRRSVRDQIRSALTVDRSDDVLEKGCCRQWKLGRKLSRFDLVTDAERLRWFAAGSNERMRTEVIEAKIKQEHLCDPAWVECRMLKYDPVIDYTEMLIQFGYVSFFSMVFPLAPLFALLNNIIEIRIDVYKLLWCKQRPIARSASGIGVWLTVLNIMSVIAVVTNCAHLAMASAEVQAWFSSRGLSSVQRIVAMVVIEHIVLAVQSAISSAVPAIPQAVQDKEKAQLRKDMAPQTQQDRRDNDQGNAGKENAHPSGLDDDTTFGTWDIDVVSCEANMEWTKNVESNTQRVRGTKSKKRAPLSPLSSPNTPGQLV